MIVCDVCRQRNVVAEALYEMKTSKKGVWFLCNVHKQAVERTLYGALTPITRIQTERERLNAR